MNPFAHDYGLRSSATVISCVTMVTHKLGQSYMTKRKQLIEMDGINFQHW